MVTSKENHLGNEHVSVSTSVHVPYLVSGELADAVGHDRQDIAKNAEHAVEIGRNVEVVVNSWQIETHATQHVNGSKVPRGILAE